MEFRRKRRGAVEIGLIPMIDVLLVLLFFFMVATTFRQQHDLKINLPQADSSQTSQVDKLINLSIDAQGLYSLSAADGKPLPLVKPNLEGLKLALAQLDSASRQLPLLINADGKTPHQAVISALDAANQIGFHQLSFAVKPQEQP